MQGVILETALHIRMSEGEHHFLVLSDFDLYACFQDGVEPYAFEGMRINGSFHSLSPLIVLDLSDHF